MLCQVVNCGNDNDRHTFHCYGACGKEFHIACVGIRRNFEEQVRSYMLPLCEHCQEEFTSVIKLRKLLLSQHTLAEDIEAANNKISAFINSFNVHEAFDRLETNLTELRDELKTAVSDSTKSINNVSSVLSEKCNMDTFESSVQQANEVLSNKIAVNMEQASSKLKTQLEDIQHSLFEMGAKEIPTTEILEEVKSLSSAVAALKLPDIELLDHSDRLTLAEELAQELALARSYNDDDGEDADDCDDVDDNDDDDEDSGWRLLGAKKIWKADWKAYDLRQLRRHQQEKVAQKARKQRKRNKRNNNNNNNKNGFNNFNYNNRSYSGHNGDHNRNNNFNNNVRNLNFGGNSNTNNILPSDKELLAVAKDRFSRPPPPPFRPTVRFERGPTLNPYPAEDELPSTSQAPDSRSWMLQMTPEYAGYSSSRSCQSCASQNSCFRKF